MYGKVVKVLASHELFYMDVLGSITGLTAFLQLLNEEFI